MDLILGSALTSHMAMIDFNLKLSSRPDLGNQELLAYVAHFMPDT